jgi:hypothetical protein
MRYSAFSAVFGVVWLACAAAMGAAGPLDKDATSKERGEWVGGSPARRGTTYRTYVEAPRTTVAPQTAATAPTAPNDAGANQPASGNAQQARQSNSSTRSFSYQGQASAAPYYAPNANSNRRNNDPRFFHAERKALGAY